MYSTSSGVLTPNAEYSSNLFKIETASLLLEAQASFTKPRSFICFLKNIIFCSSSQILQFSLSVPSNSFKQNECMVEICILFMSFSGISIFESLSLSSSAALMVNVITKNDSGLAPLSSRYFTLSVRTNVFPAPGPASMSRGLFSSNVMHSFCFLLYVFFMEFSPYKFIVNYIITTFYYIYKN